MEEVGIILNNNGSQFISNRKTLEKLRGAFSYKHPQAFYLRPHMPRGWDGCIYPISENGNIPTGLIPKVIDWLNENKIPYELEDERYFPTFIGIPQVVAGLTLREDQHEIVSTVLHNFLPTDPPIFFPRGIINASMNAGKTLMMMAIHKSFEGANTLILLKDSQLYKQFLKDMPKAFEYKEWGSIQGKNIKWGSITVAMVQTLVRHIDEFKSKLEGLDIVLVDECDESNNKTFKKVIKHTYNASIRIGLSGTVFLRNLAKDRPKNYFLWSFFGKELAKIKMKELMDKGISTKVIVKINRGNPYMPMSKDYDKAYKECISLNPKRNGVILDRVLYYVKRNKTPILIVCRFHEHVEELYKLIHRKFGLKLDVRFIHNEAVSRDRDLEAFRNGECDILISSLITKRGQNLPLTKVIINAAGGDNPETPLQILGRGTRLHESKTKVYYEDFWDMGEYFLRHSKHRYSYYLAERLKIIKVGGLK